MLTASDESGSEHEPFDDTSSLDSYHSGHGYGVGREFMMSLPHVPQDDIAKNEACPICKEPFLENPENLVVRLPCPGEHRFDIDCIRDWLRTNLTCPMCRYVLSSPYTTELETDLLAEDNYLAYDTYLENDGFQWPEEDIRWGDSDDFRSADFRSGDFIFGYHHRYEQFADDYFSDCGLGDREWFW